MIEDLSKQDATLHQRVTQDSICNFCDAWLELRLLRSHCSKPEELVLWKTALTMNLPRSSALPSVLCSSAVLPPLLPAVLRYGRKRCAKCTMALLVTALSITCTLHSNSWAPMHNVLHISMSEYGAQCKCHWESWHCLPMGANNLVNWLPDLVLSRCISKIYQNLSIDVTNYWNQGIRH